MRLKYLNYFAIITLAVFLFSAHFSLAAYPSQCTGFDQSTGTQTGCSDKNDQKILNEQCSAQYPPSVCSSMDSYLSYMASECYRVKASGYNCAKISEDGIYGSEASRFAKYVEENSAAISPADKQKSAENKETFDGTLDFPTGFNFPDPQGGIIEVLATFLNWILGIIGVIGMISLVVSGLQYFLAAGDDKMAETAKRNMTYSIIGIIAALAGFIVVKAVDALLRANTLF